MTDRSKTYRCTLRLGMTTDTQDVFGTVLKTGEVAVTEEELRSVIFSFCGDILQIPPMYSALKVNGKKLYDLARAGVEIERTPRPVTIEKIEILSVELPRVILDVTCSKGTYIRTLCHDIGETLGCGGCMEELQRRRVGEFFLEDALTLSQVEELVREGTLSQQIRSIDSLFTKYSPVYATKEGKNAIDNGNRISPEWISNRKPQTEQEIVRLYDEGGIFVGLYQYQEAGDLKPVKLFWEKEEKP